MTKSINKARFENWLASKDMDKLKGIFVGNGKLLIACHQILVKNNIELTAVITDDHEVAALFKEKGVKTYKSLKKIISFEIDYIFSINNPKVFTKSLLEHPRIACINYHDSLLPNYGGFNATAWAVLDKRNEHGVTWHIMSSVIDAGDILEQDSFAVSTFDTTFNLNVKCFEAAIRSFERLCNGLLGNTLSKKKNFLDRSSFHYFAQKPVHNGIINCCKDIDSILALVRSASVGPYDNTFIKPKLIIENQTFHIENVSIERDLDDNERSYRVYNITENSIFLSFEDKLLKLETLEPVEEELINKELTFTAHDSEALKSITNLTKLSEKQEKSALNAFRNYDPCNIIHESYFKSATNQEINHIKAFPIKINPEALEVAASLFRADSRSILLSVFLIYLFENTNANISCGILSPQELPPHLTQVYSSIHPFNFPILKSIYLKNLVEDVKLALSCEGIYSLDMLKRYGALQDLADLSQGELFPLIFGVSTYSELVPSNSIYIQLCHDHFQLHFNANQINKEIWNLENELSAEEKFTTLLTSQLNAILLKLGRKNRPQEISLTDFFREHQKKFALEEGYNFQTNNCLHTNFIKKAKDEPNKIAVIDNGVKLSYGELLSVAYYYAEILREKGLKPANKVAVFIDKGWQQIVACLSISIAGGCYVPLNTKDPTFRLKKLLEQCAASFILSDEHNEERVNTIHEKTTISIKILPSHPQPFILTDIDPDQDAYVIFTSGTTGNPKGVVISHRAACNTIEDINFRIQLNSTDKVLLLSELFFDLSVYDIFGTLAAGATIVIANEKDVKEPSSLLHYIANEKISVWNSVPAYFLMLLEYMRGIDSQPLKNSLRTIMLSGDWIPIDLPQKSSYFFPNANILSLGGATEAAIWSIYYAIDIKREYIRSIPYGYSLSNQKVVVLGSNYKKTAPGVIGKIYILGQGLAKGYIGNLKLTNQRFIKHPHTGQILYDTGDMGKYYEDGCIEFCGRQDTEVKISGHRIELKEVEFAAKQYPAVEQALSLIYKNKLEHSAIALFITTKKDEHLSTSDLSKSLREILPSYMTPSKIFLLENFPKTTNGKINYTLLRRKAEETASSKEEDQQNLPEKLLEIITIWEEVLSTHVVSTDDFISLGGNSLSAVQIVSRLQKKLNYSLRLADFYYAKTPLGLYQNFIFQENSHFPYLEKCQETEVELSSNQKRLWFLNQQDSLSPFYNMVFAFDIHGEISVTAFQNALNKIVKRFDALRSIVVLKDGTPYWSLRTPPQETLDLIKAHNRDAALYLAQSLSQRPFNLSTGPLFRTTLIEYEPNNKFLLIINAHHIIFDGWSFSILINALNSYLNPQSSSKILLNHHSSHFSYLDYCHWQNKIENSARRDDDHRYWSQKFATPATFLGFPLDMKRPEIDNYSGKNLYFELPEALSKKLRDFSKKHGVTLYSLILSGFSVLLHKYTLQNDIIIGGSYANRPLSELENIIGFFANTLALRLSITKNDSFIQLVKQAHRVILEAIDHQNIGFNEIVEIINPKRSLNNNPIFQVALVLLNLEFPSLEIDMAKTTPIDIDLNASRFDFTIYFYDQFSKIKGYVEYNTNLFLQETISQLIKYLECTLSYFMDYAETEVGSLQILTPLLENGCLPRYALKEQTRKNDSILDLFRSHALKSPNAKAIEYLNHSISYQELYNMAITIAGNIQQELLDSRNKLIGFYLERSHRTIAAMLGILISGNAFIPLDLSWPQDRINQIVYNSKMAYLISSSHLVEHLQEIPTGILLLDDLLTPTKILANHASKVDLNETAYIIYTSGTTGIPKGVEISHQSLIALFDSTVHLFNFSQHDVWLQFHSYAFDVSIWEIFGAIFSGAKLVIPTEEDVRSPPEIIHLIEKHGVTILNQTPTAFYQLQHFFSEETTYKLMSLKYIVFAGERLNFQKLKPWHDYFTNKPSPRLINMYGITEITVHATFYEIPIKEYARSNSVIGKLLGHFNGVILDENGNPLPPGLPGELYLSGNSLAKSYLHNDTETHRKFITYKKQRVYRTGDLVRRRTDNQLEYLNRIDRQSKIRGYRIELEEIENILRECPIVMDAVAIADNTNSEISRLLVFTTLKDDHESDKTESSSRIGAWKDIFDQAYHNDHSQYNLKFNISGWNSAFTRKPFSEATMYEWLENALHLLKLLMPKEIIEIGCGSGMILFNLLSDCQKYIASDVSNEAVKIIKSQINKLSSKERSKIKIFNRDASDLQILEEHPYETVILNSVIQYFPNIEYLNITLKQILKNLKSGKVFIGDIRNYDLLDLFHKNLKAYVLKYKPTICNFEAIADSSRKQERELAVSPAYFLSLQKQFPDIKRVNFFIKDSDKVNELNLFRYEVVIFKGEDSYYEPGITYLNWKENNISLDSINNYLAVNKPYTLGISHVPNPRQCASTSLEKWLKYNTDNLAYSEILEKDYAGITLSFNSFKQLAKRHGYHIYFLLSIENPLEFYHIAFIRKDLPSQDIAISIQPPVAYNLTKNTAYSNIPQLPMYPEKIIREYLKGKLPGYALPESITILDSFPMNSSGKLDVNKLLNYRSASLPPPDDHSVPLNETEFLILKTWKEYLRNENITIEDNFFEIGGDSITSLMIISKLNELGLKIGPKDIFKWQTVKELASNLNIDNLTSHNPTNSESEEINLIPIQYWFFEKSIINYNHWNFSFCLNVEQGLLVELLEKAISYVINSYDIFSYRFLKINEKWVQKKTSHSQNFYFEALKPSDSIEQKNTLPLAYQKLQKQINISNGPLIAFQYILTAEPKLIITCHHLIMDGFSVRLLMKSINDSYNALLNNQYLPPLKTNPYHVWANKLVEHANDLSLETLMSYWSQTKCGLRKMFPFFKSSNWGKSYITITKHINISNSKLRGSQTFFDHILTAVSQALMHCLKIDSIKFDIERHCRDIFNNADATNIIGWLTTIYPVLLAHVKGQAISKALKDTVDQIKLLRGHEYTYGLLKYYRKAFNSDDSLVLFNYHGEIQNESSGFLKFDHFIYSNLYDTSYESKYLIEINSLILNGSLEVSITYNKDYFDTNLIDDCFKQVHKNLEILTKVSKSDSLVSELPLTTMQRNLLDDFGASILNNHFFHKIIFKLSHKLDITDFRMRLLNIIASHPAMRAYFDEENQCLNINDDHILEHGYLEIINVNDSNHKEAEEAINEVLKKENTLGFNLHKAPLIKLILIQFADRSILIMKYQQLLFDGWSISNILKGLFENNININAQIKNEMELTLLKAFISHNSTEKAKDSALKFWREYPFSENQHPLLNKKMLWHPENSVENDCIFRKTLSIRDTLFILQRAKTYKVTLNSYMSYCWGRTLSLFSKKENVQFGVMLAGRDTPNIIFPFEKIDSLVWNVFELIPVSMSFKNITTIEEDLHSFQMSMLHAADFANLTIPELRKISNQQSLFDTVITYQNYPTYKEFSSSHICIEDIEYQIKTNYPLTLRIIPDEMLKIDFCYNKLLLSHEEIEELYGLYIQTLLNP